jgi:hypothetical protein
MIDLGLELVEGERELALTMSNANHASFLNAKILLYPSLISLIGGSNVISNELGVLPDTKLTTTWLFAGMASLGCSIGPASFSG